jgi:hypothetical protein
VSELERALLALAILGFALACREIFHRFWVSRKRFLAALKALEKASR